MKLINSIQTAFELMMVMFFLMMLSIGLYELKFDGARELSWVLLVGLLFFLVRKVYQRDKARKIGNSPLAEIEALALQAGSQNKYLYNVNTHEWKSPDEILDDRTTKDHIELSGWEIRGEEDHLQWLNEEKKKIDDFLETIRYTRK
jgi:hypothetical protein